MIGALAVVFLLAGVLRLVGFLGRMEGLRRRPRVRRRDAVAVGSGGVVASAALGAGIAVLSEGGIGPWGVGFVVVATVASTVEVLAENTRSDWRALMDRLRLRRR